MTVRVYRSTDGSAPVLTGQVGALIALLDACLVTGYGSATPAGWTKPYLDTNIAVYRMGAGNQRYLRIDDSNAQDSRVHAFIDMTSVSDFTSSFIAGTISSATGLAVKKSITADATVRAWVIVATETAVYLFLEPAQANLWRFIATNSSSGNGQLFFGDFISYKPGDIYNTALIGPTSTTVGNGYLGAASNQISSAISGHYIAKSYLNLSFNGCHKGIPGSYHSSSAMGATSVLFPDPLTGGMQFSTIELVEIVPGGGFLTRGRMPGVWTSLNNIPVLQGYEIPGTGILAGKTLLTIAVWSTSNQGRMFIETSNTW